MTLKELPIAGMELLFAALLLITTVIFFLPKLISKKLGRRRLEEAKRLPPGPRNLPLIGSIPHLVHRQPAHHTLRDLSTIHGPIMYLRLGERRIVIISSSEAASEIMKTHDLAFASRPLTASIKILCYGGKDLIFAPYGEYWRQMRRFCFLELLSPKRVLSFRAIREEEVSLLLKSIASTSGVMFNLGSKLAGLSNNIAARAIVGGTCEDQKTFLLANDEVIKFALNFSLIELYPSIPNFISHLASFRLRRACLNLDRILEKTLKEHREKRAMARGELEEDVTDVLLRLQQDSSNSNQIPLTDIHIKAVINDILLAGSETSSTAIEWVMSELVRNQSAMKKAQIEVRDALKGKASKRMVEEELLSGKLSYLQLVINETLRLHPPVPLLLPRENQEPCVVMGYEIPAKTTVMVNAWAIGRDPNTWKDPDSFRPERFEGNRCDLKGTNFEFIPFGAGRRMCPGIHFGSATIETTLAYLLYYFDWRYIPVKGEELDIAETFGVALRKKTPLCLMASPHFPLPSI